jgi:hypothetical protein
MAMSCNVPMFVDRARGKAGVSDTDTDLLSFESSSDGV